MIAVAKNANVNTNPQVEVKCFIEVYLDRIF